MYLPPARNVLSGAVTARNTEARVSIVQSASPDTLVLADGARDPDAAGTRITPGGPPHVYGPVGKSSTATATATRARYLHRITEGDMIISEEELTGYAYRPPWNVLERVLVTSGFAQAEGPKDSSQGRLA
jgi:hypothetical protein